MAQKSYLGIMVAPSGHRLITQAGTHAFATAGNDITLTLQLKRPVAAFVKPNQMMAADAKTAQAGAYIPYVSVSQYTQVPTRRLIVSRKTGGVAGLQFSYQVIGY